MDYKKIHEQFILYFKSTTPIERILKRDPNDFRLLLKYIYTEKHHVLPKSLGGNNDSENLVVVLPEEHLFLHILRYKAFGFRQDFLAIRYIINCFEKIKRTLKIDNGKFLTFKYNKKIKKSISLYNTLMYNFKKKVGFHSEKQKKLISESKKGKIVVKDAKTGEKIGMIDKNHPKFLSGEWCHITKGFTTMINTLTGKKERFESHEKKPFHKVVSPREKELNTNYSGLTDDSLLEIGLLFVKKYNFIPSNNLIIMFAKKYNYKFLKYICDFRFKEFGGGWNGFYKALEEKTNLKYYSGKHNTAERIQRVRKIIKDLKND